MRDSQTILNAIGYVKYLVQLQGSGWTAEQTETIAALRAMLVKIDRDERIERRKEAFRERGHDNIVGPRFPSSHATRIGMTPVDCPECGDRMLRDIVSNNGGSIWHRCSNYACPNSVTKPLTT